MEDEDDREGAGGDVDETDLDANGMRAPHCVALRSVVVMVQAEHWVGNCETKYLLFFQKFALMKVLIGFGLLTGKLVPFSESSRQPTSVPAESR